MKQDTLWILTRIQQDGPTFSQEPCFLNFNLLSVGPRLVVFWYQSLMCLVSLLFTPPMPILHPTLFLKERFFYLLVSLLFLYHAAVQINTYAFAKRVAGADTGFSKRRG